jgi:hypothetical protein
MRLLKIFLFLSLFIASSAHAQIGWTLEECQEHWGRESRMDLPSEAYVFDGGRPRPIPGREEDEEDSIQPSKFKITKRVTFDFDQGKVKDISYLAYGNIADDADDAGMKKLIVGTWSLGELEDYNSRFTTYQEDGTVLMEVHNFEMKWDVKNGELIETPLPDGASTDRMIWPGKLEATLLQVNVFTILFLTNHEFLVREKSAHTQAYIFMSR